MASSAKTTTARKKREVYYMTLHSFVISFFVNQLFFSVSCTLKANDHRPRTHGVLWMHRLRPREFRQAFRMTRVAFFRLLRLVKEDLTKSTVRAIASSGSPVTPLIKLAATIRWLVCFSEFIMSSRFLFTHSRKGWRNVH